MSKRIAATSLSLRERVSAEQTGEGLALNVTSSIPSSVASRATFSRPGEGLARYSLKVEPLARLDARRTKNFAESDRLRDELVAMGIQLKDGKDPVTGDPTTVWEVKR